jgi:hypothetical protein
MGYSGGSIIMVATTLLWAMLTLLKRVLEISLRGINKIIFICEDEVGDGFIHGDGG